MERRLSSIAKVLASIPEQEDPIPHLAFLSTDDLLLLRREIHQSIKYLEEERQAVDSEFVETFSDAELRFGISSEVVSVPPTRHPSGGARVRECLVEHQHFSQHHCPELRSSGKDGRPQQWAAAAMVNPAAIGFEGLATKSSTM